MTDIADTATPVADQTQEIAKPLTIVEARAARMSKLEQGDNTDTTDATTEEEVKVDTPEVEAEPEAPDVTETEDTEVEEEVTTNTDEEEEEVLSQADEIDVDDLSEDDIYALAKLKGIDIENPKSSKAWAEQRKELKALKDQIETISKERDEAISLAPVSDSPFAGLRDTEQVDKAIEQAEINADYWNDKLVLNQESHYDEETGQDVKGITHEGKFYPATEVLAFVKAEKAKVKPLRERKQEISKQSELFKDQDQKVETIKTSLGLEGDAGEAYEKMITSPKFALVKSLIPEYGLELMDLLGHAARSQVQGVKKPVVRRKAPRSKDESVSLGTTGRTSASSASGREAQLNKIVNGAGRSSLEKMNAMRELRLLRTKQK